MKKQQTKENQKDARNCKDPVKSRSPLRSWQKALLLCFGFFILGILELGLRVFGYGQPAEQEDPFVEFEKVVPLYGPREEAEGEILYSTYPNRLVAFNDQAFPLTKPDGTFRIFCLGGSTTYGRPYEAPTAFPRWLEITLNEMDPSTHYEVINAGAISYASYRIVNVIQELVGYEPDLFILYTGHNEFLEARTYGDILRGSPALRGLRAALSGLRTYNWVGRLVAGAKAWESTVRTGILLKEEVDTVLDQVGGLELYTRDEEGKQDILAHFRFNLERLIRIARAHQVEILLTTPVSNIRDFSPFKSQHAAGLSPESRKAWEESYREGYSLSEPEDHATALAAYRKALEIDPKYADLHYEIAKCYDVLGRHEKAKKHYTSARDEDICPLRAITPIETILRDVSVETGTMLVDLVPVFEERSDHGLLGNEWFLDHLHPTVEGHQLIADQIATRLMNEGIVSADAGETSKGKAPFAAALRSLKPEYYALKDLNLGKVMTWAKQYEEARESLERAERVMPENAEIQTHLGEVYTALGQSGKAVSAYRLAVAGKPDDARLHNNLGNAYEAHGKHEMALTEYKIALRLNPRNPLTHNNLGNIHAALGKYENAITEYGIEIRLDPGNAEVWKNLGDAHWAIGQIDRAIEAYRGAIRTDREDAETHFTLGELYRKNESYPEAIAAYQDALEVGRRRGDTDFRLAAGAYAALGRSYRAIGDDDRAVSSFRSALRLEPDDAGNHNNLGNVYASGEQYEKAAEQYAEAIRLSPDNVDIQSNLGNAYLAGKNYRSAIEVYRKTLAINPNRLDLQMNIGIAYLSTGNRPLAAVAFERALEIDPENGPAKRHLHRMGIR